MYLLQLLAVERYGLEQLGVLLSEFPEGQRGELSVDVVYLGVWRGFHVGREAKLQRLQPAEGERSLEVAEAAIVNEEMPAVPEMMNERLIKLLLAQVISLQFYLDLVILQIFRVELLISAEIRIDFVQLQHLLRRHEYLLLLVIVGGLQELFFQDLLRVLRPFQVIEVVDELSAHLFLLGGALLGRLKVYIPEKAAKFQFLAVSEKLFHLGYVVLYLPALLLQLQLFHPPPGRFFDLPQLTQVLLHFDDLLEDILMV